MRQLREFIVVILAMMSVVTVPLGCCVFVGGLGGRLADTDFSHNLWLGCIALMLCLLPPVSSLVLMWVWRGRWLP